MKKLDWYILRKFLGTFVFIMALLLGITIVIDLSEKIDPFVANHATPRVIIFDYYIYFLPYITSLIGPFFVLVSVIFFTSQLAARSEIIAILNSGTSFYRMLWPYFMGATILATIFFLGNHYFVPYSNGKRIAFERTYVSKPLPGLRYNFHRMIEPGTIIYIENYKPSEKAGFKFSVDKFKNGKLVYKLLSDKIEWDSTKHRWQIHNYYIRELNNSRDKITSGALLDTKLAFSPDDIKFAEIFKDEMTTTQLTDYINDMIKTGQPDVEFYEVEKYRRTSSAFSIYILTLIGVSLASRKMRGGLGWHLVLGIGLSALYEIIMKFSITFSTNSSLPPILGVWIPNLLFMVLAIYLMKTAPK